MVRENVSRAQVRAKKCLLSFELSPLHMHARVLHITTALPSLQHAGNSTIATAFESSERR
jgi:hypothetical protein